MLGTAVRWCVALLVCCLLAGSTGNGRPHIELAHDTAGELRLASAEGVLPLVTARRAAAPAPEQRLAAPAILPPSPTFVAPPRALVARAAAPAPRLSPDPGRATSARGPPDDRFSVEITVRS